MLQPKVTIIMSTYQGEQYVVEQLESLFKQTYPSISIIVRDDGSTDGTLKILETYEKQKKITLIRGKNIGLVKSFFKALQEAEPSSYYAYCDQDDVWIPEKIQRAVEALEKEKGQKQPMLYFTEFYYCDPNLQVIKSSCMNKKGISFKNAILECIASGNTMVFNEEMKHLILKTSPEDICLHDWWTYMVGVAFGKVLYDSRPSVYYRRGNQNVTPDATKPIRLQLIRVKKFWRENYFSNVQRQIERFAKEYFSLLSPDNKEVLLLFLEKKKKNISQRIRKVFFPQRFRQNLTDELLVRSVFLMGKL